jgi:hypothetical protein
MQREGDEINEAAAGNAALQDGLRRVEENFDKFSPADILWPGYATGGFVDRREREQACEARENEERE